jgi:CelD/BcsL family acetyltransferase involved in cellulose biosynthesis/peptidoglycan/xylan/chitin deacetylase (PgdA/CDA1 family)
MKVIEIRDAAGFAELRPLWDGLLERSTSASIFLTWEWMSAWWSAYGPADGLRVFLITDEFGRPAGIAPMREASEKRYGLPYRKLSFVGDGSCDSDYLDFLIAAGCERPVLETWWRHLRDELADGLLLELNEIPAASPSLAVLDGLAAENRFVQASSDVPCGAVSLPAAWPDYLKTLTPRFRTKIRSVLRSLGERGDVDFGFCGVSGELDGLLASLYDLHTRRWANDGKPGVFRWDQKRQFYETVSPLLLERGWLRLSRLKWKGRVLACQYGFLYRDRYFQLQEGYEPACEHWNLGAGLRAWSIQRLIGEGVREYDFLGGVSRHKSNWGAETKLSKRVVIGRATAANVLFCRGPEWNRAARETAKRFVLGRWIEQRNQRLQTRTTAAEPGRAGGGWKRRLLASCYYFSGAPRLLRPLRDRYCLGGSGHLRLERRAGASARIVYYHRVNDEQDPFFPSTSPARFEREIAFLARHYHVVSLAEAIRRLNDGGPAEPVVVITFDDGYEDNFRLAVPILERYGLPATLFLATGAIDSRAPLWFERLALALRQSPHASVDVELDVPRRFPLGTQPARLSANAEIYTFLRYCPDGERQDRLNQIIRLLGGCDESARIGGMLTWEQVRALQRRGIAFGGHTVTHPFVSRLSPERARWEAAECKRRIEAELQVPVEHFAYPSGREMDFSPWNKQVLETAGYHAAVSTLWGVNHPDTDRMELRRGQPWETTRAEFAAKFDWYQWLDA